MFNNKGPLYLYTSAGYNKMSIIGEFASLNQIGSFYDIQMWLFQSQVSLFGNSPYVDNYNGGQLSFIGTKTDCVSTVHSLIKISIIG